MPDLCWFEPHVDFPLCIQEGRSVHHDPARFNLQLKERILRRIFPAELGFRVQDLGFRVQDSGFRVQGSGCRVQNVVMFSEEEKRVVRTVSGFQRHAAT